MRSVEFWSQRTCLEEKVSEKVITSGGCQEASEEVVGRSGQRGGGWKGSEGAR